MLSLLIEESYNYHITGTGSLERLRQLEEAGKSKKMARQRVENYKRKEKKFEAEKTAPRYRVDPTAKLKEKTAKAKALKEAMYKKAKTNEKIKKEKERIKEIERKSKKREKETEKRIAGVQAKNKALKANKLKRQTNKKIAAGIGAAGLAGAGVAADHYQDQIQDAAKHVSDSLGL